MEQKETLGGILAQYITNQNKINHNFSKMLELQKERIEELEKQVENLIKSQNDSETNKII